MDSAVYWLGMIARLLLALVLIRLCIWGVMWVVEKVWGVRVGVVGWRLMGLDSITLRSSTYELEIIKLFVSIKWFDSTCRHFFKVNIGRLHVDYALFPPQTNSYKKTPIKPNPLTRPTVRQRFLFWLLQFISKRVELCVSSVKVYVHDAMDKDIDFLAVLLVKDCLSLLAQPMPDKMLAVSLEVENATAQLFVHYEKKSEQDDYSPLLELQCSSRIYLYLQPLTHHGSPLASIQINTAPLSCTLLREGAFRYAVQHLNSYLPPTKTTVNIHHTSSLSQSLEDHINKLPKVEMVLEDVSLHHQVKETNRVISSKMSRVCLDFSLDGSKVLSTSLSTDSHSELSAMIGIQDLTATDSLSREFLKLKRLVLNTKYSLKQLSNMIKVESLHSTLREDEMVYWSKYFIKSISSLRETASSHKQKRGNPSSSVKGVPDILRMVMTSSAVTTMEATDWSMSMRMDTPTLQAKDPLVQAVSASCAINLQWTNPDTDNTSAIVRASIRMEDSYLHIPGYNPTLSSESTVFRPRPDDPTVLPSLHRHQWGHLLALGSLTLKAEKHIAQTVDLSSVTEAVQDGDTLSSKTTLIETNTRKGRSIPSIFVSSWDWRNIVSVLMTGEQASVTGEVSSLMVEWSTPTTVALLKTLQHLKQHYNLFGGVSAGKSTVKKANESLVAVQLAAMVDRGIQSSSTKEELVSTERQLDSNVMSHLDSVHNDNYTSGGDDGWFDSVMQGLSTMNLTFRITDANAFIYGVMPEPPTLMLRLDAASLSSPQSSSSSVSPSFQINLHGLLLDSLSFDSTTSPSFLCSPLANLPVGVGVGMISSLNLKYQHSLKEISVTASRVETSWSPTHHQSLFHVITEVWNRVKDLQQLLKPEWSTGERTPEQPQVIGERLKKGISNLPLSLAVNLENMACHAIVGKHSSMCLVLQTSHCILKDNKLVADTYELGIVFDKHRIVTIDNLKAVFPREEGDAGKAERIKMKQIELNTNPVIDLSATRTKVIFPYGYKFGATLDKVMNVRKYLHQLHNDGTATGSLPLSPPPDIHLQCGEVSLQLCEDPFEAKLMANYELMCDEYEQKLDRQKALDKKVEELKQKQGEFNLSAKKIQSLYDSLMVKDCQIYCRRAQELHGSPDAGRDELFVFSLERMQLWAMFDPSMLGRERLVNHIQEIDDISPFPEGKYEFSTLWGMYVSGDTDKLQFQLRDYPHPLLQGTNWKVNGRMVFAEQEAQDRETRTAVVDLGHPWNSVTVQRKLPPLKYYYDLEMDSTTFIWSHGPCLEPALAQTNIALNLLTNPTVDPSRPLAYWDKFRLLFHGRIHFLTKETTIILPATFDPYNTVSYIEIILRNLHTTLITNKKLELEGCLQAYVHNATKYDDCELANFPHVKTSLTCHWVCAGREPHNHHAVRRCAPDKMPVLPDKQVHDSYNAFRSKNLDVDWTLQALPQKDTDPNPPSLLLFFSTLRWLQRYQVLLGINVTRPIRKGSMWNTVRKRQRPTLLRHWRNLKIDVNFPKSVLTIWTSVAKQRGVECIIESGTASISYKSVLTPYTDGLIRRPNRTWNVVSFSGNVKDLIVFIEKSKDRTSKSPDEGKDEEETPTNTHATMEEEQEDVEVEQEEDEEEEGETTRTILGYTAELSYKRLETENDDDDESESLSENFTHKLNVLNTRILVTASNKQVVLGLYDSYKQAQTLKRDLSAEALKSLVTVVESPMDTSTTGSVEDIVGSSNEQSISGSGGSSNSSRPSSARRTKRHSSSGNVMLDQLLKDLGNRHTIAEDTSSVKAPLKGFQLASEEDVTHKNWLITMTNIQVVLKGIETSGYIVASSNKAQIFGQEHQPVLKEGDLMAKKSWLTRVDKLQYFSTFGSIFKGGRVPWLPLSVISSPSPTKQEKSSSIPRDSESSLNALLSQLGPLKSDDENEQEIEGSKSQSSSREATVGGLVNCLLIPADRDRGRQELRGGSIQGASLQRIASRCQCSIIYVSYGGQAEPEIYDTALLTPEKASPGLSGNRSEAVDTLTVTYPTVRICTTSDQHALIMDILTNLVLHKESGKKEVLDHRAHMQFVVQLSDIQDPRKPVLVQQNKVRRCLQTLRSLEHKVFVAQRQIEASDEELLEQELAELETSLVLAKEEMSMATMRLRAMIRAFKEIRLLPQPGQFSGAPEPVHRIEIWLDDAHWWLTQKDGQLEIADINLTNFSYNSVTFSDDSIEHRLELGSFEVHNLTPNTPPIYQQVLVPYDPKSRRLRVDRNICLRVYCRDKARVAGITVREHLEVNIVPLQVSLTARFYQTMQDFFFPKMEGDGPDPGPLEHDHSHLFGVQPTHSFGVDMADSPLLYRSASTHRSSLSLTTSTSHTSLQHVQHAGYSPPTSPGPKDTRKSKHLSLSNLDTVKKMKERASHINALIYVKIPQTTLCITYKGENWSYKDLQNQVMNMPTLEYHNRNWTWKDMLMEVKKDYKNAIIHQTLKSAIGMKESAESSGLASPKLQRHGGDLLLGPAKNKNSKTGMGKKLLGKLSSTKEDSDSDKDTSPGSASPVLMPLALRDQETNLKRTYQRLTKLSQEAQK